MHASSAGGSNRLRLCCVVYHGIFLCNGLTETHLYHLVLTVDVVDTDCRVYRNLSASFAMVVYVLCKADEGCGCRVTTDVRLGSVLSVLDASVISFDRHGVTGCLDRGLS